MIRVERRIDANDLKCGEIFRHDTTFTYNVACIKCSKVVSFENFRDHFESEHYYPQPATDGFAINLKEESIGITFSDNESINKGASDVEEAIEDDVDPLLPKDNEILDPNIDNDWNKDYDLLKKTKDDCENDENKVKSNFHGVTLPVDVNIKSSDTENEESHESSTEKDDPAWGTEKNENKKSQSAKKRKTSFNFNCKLCPRKYTTKYVLASHMKRDHQVELDESVKCKECGKILANEKKLDLHMYEHTGIVCDICGKSFTQIGTLRNHKKRHTGIKPFGCQQCERGFYTRKELQIHIMTHTGILPQICEVCGKRFRDVGPLTVHMRRHTGERPAKCNVCGKSFYSFHDLNVHAVSHTSERPFVCDVCGSSFQRRKALRIHKKLHTRDMKHECKICGRKFPLKGGLTSHMRKHAATLSANLGNKPELAEMVSDTYKGFSTDMARSSTNNMEEGKKSELKTKID